LLIRTFSLLVCAISFSRRHESNPDLLSFEIARHNPGHLFFEKRILCNSDLRRSALYQLAPLCRHGRASTFRLLRRIGRTTTLGAADVDPYINVIVFFPFRFACAFHVPFIAVPVASIERQ
jgi:hypothetical protein